MSYCTGSGMLIWYMHVKLCSCIFKCEYIKLKYSINSLKCFDETSLLTLAHLSRSIAVLFLNSVVNKKVCSFSLKWVERSQLYTKRAQFIYYHEFVCVYIATMLAKLS